MKRELLLALTFLLIAGTSFGQFKPGFIIPNDSDTLKGFVSWVGERVNFKVKKNERSEAYNMDELEGFGILDREFKRACVMALVAYFQQEICGFLQLIEKGKVNLYRLDYVDIHGDDALPNFYLCRGESELYLLAPRGGSFKKIMTRYFADNDEIMQSVKSKAYTWKNIQQLVHDYNSGTVTTGAVSDPKNEEAADVSPDENPAKDTLKAPDGEESSK